MTTNRMPPPFKLVARDAGGSTWAAAIDGQRVEVSFELWLGSVSSWWHSVALTVDGVEVVARQSRSFSQRKADQRWAGADDARSEARAFLKRLAAAR